MIAVVFAIASSVAYVIPNAQAAEVLPEVAAAKLQQFDTQVSEPVASSVVVAAITRDTYGVTLPPPPPPPAPVVTVAGLLLTPSSSATIQWPVPSTTRMSTGFGPRSCSGCSSNHQGIDLNAPSGTPVRAMADGVVIETNAAGYSALGVHVRIQHVIDGEIVTSVYAHMQVGSMPFVVGNRVVAGQVLGAVGCTGSCTGTHLHFEIHPGGGAAVDPAAWLHARLG